VKLKSHVNAVLTARAVEFIKMVKGKLLKALFNATFVEIVITDLVKHQSYQQVKTILLIVKYALS